jgi:hypothetical protein
MADDVNCLFLDLIMLLGNNESQHVAQRQKTVHTPKYVLCISAMKQYKQ